MIYNKISIITPSYNQGEYIEEAIKSVLKQNYSNFEHIIIDAGSTDQTLDILKKYKHLKWISEKDDGQSDALNKGFKKSKGQIIGWLNADDFYEKNIFRLINNNLSIEGVDAVYGDFIEVDKYGNRIKKIITQMPSNFMMKYVCYIPSTTFFFNRKIIDNNIYIDKNLKLVMDKDFFCKIISKGYKINKIHKFLGFFRWHYKNKSIYSKKFKKRIHYEGIIINNRYSNFKLPNNYFGQKIYYLMNRTVILYRFFCRKTGLGVHYGNKKYKLKDRFI